MAILPLDQAIPRFKGNEERFDKFVNGTDLEWYVDSEGTAVPTIQKWLKDKSQLIDSEFAGPVFEAEQAAAAAAQSALEADASADAAQDILDQINSSVANVDEKVFVGNGVVTTFTLDRDPLNEENILVWIGGAIQDTTMYSVTGTTLTIIPAVPNGVKVRTVILTQVSADGMEAIRDETIAAKNAAEAAAAQAAANSAFTYNTIALAAAATIPAGTHSIVVNGATTLGDGFGGLYVDYDTGSNDTFVSVGGRNWWRAADEYKMPTDQLAKLPSPAIIENWDYRWPIFRFAGGETERAKALSLRDFGPVFQSALTSGERVHIPAFDGYPIRSANGLSATHGVEVINTPIDVECAKNALIIAGEIFWNAQRNVLQFVGSGNDSNEDEDFASMTPFSWRGGIISGRQLTLDHGTGTGFGNGLMNLVGMFMPEIQGVFFDGGTVAPSLNLVGAGAIDTLLGLNACVAPSLKDSALRGAYDLAVYLNGPRIYTTLAANPLASTNGSAQVVVTYPSHGMRNGDRCHLKGVVSFNGITLSDGEYGISNVTTNTFEVVSTTVATSSGSGGGTGVIVLNSRSNKRSESILGEAGIIQNCWFTRNANGVIGSKRNNRGIYVLNNTFRSNGADVSTSGIGEAEGADGKRIKIIGNNFYRTLGHPIRVLGGGGEVIIAQNTIENFGRQLYDNGATHVNFSSDLPVAGIAVYSLLRAKIIDNFISMTDNYAGATWETNEEPAAIKLSRNLDYESGCADCEVDGNIISDVPQPYNDASSGLRTRIGNRNFVRNPSKNSVYGSAGVSISANKSLVSGNFDLSVATTVVVNIPHGLDYTPAVGSCTIGESTSTTNNHRLGWGPRIVSTDATNVVVAINVTTAQAGQTLTVNVHIR